MTIKAKKVWMHEYGGADVLTLTDAIIPEPEAGQVIIETEVIGVNYSDTLRRRNLYFQPTPLPYVLGAEAVGNIIAVGPGVEAPFKKGTRVLAILPFGGGYATHVTAIATYCVPLPPEIDSRTAAGIFVQGSTAQLMISELAGDLKNKSVLITAAAGGVGSLLVQLAAEQGAKVFAACSSQEKLQVAKTHGAAVLIDYSLPNWPSAVKAANDELGIDLLFETTGGNVYNEAVKLLSPGGHVVVYGCASGVQGNIHPEYFVDENLTQSGFNLAYYITQKTNRWQLALGTLINKIIEGQLKIHTTHSFTLAQVAEAHTLIEARKTTGKVILTI